MQVPRLINDYIVYDELTNGGIISSNNSIYSAYNSAGTLYIDTNNNLQSQSNNGVLYMKDNLQTYSTTGIIIYNSNSRYISSINYPANGVMTYVNETSSIEGITPPASSISILICDKSGNIVWSNSITNNTDNVLVYNKRDGITSISNSTNIYGVVTNAHYINDNSFVEGVYQLTNKFILNDAEIIDESNKVVNQMYIPVGSPSDGLFPAKVNESNVIPSGDFAGMFVNGKIITSNIFTLNNYLNSINTSYTINSILAYSNSKIVRSTLPTFNDFYTLIQNNNVITYSSVKDIPATYKYVSGTHLIKNVINSSINLSNILCISSGTGSNIQQVMYDNGDNGVLTVDANNNIKINNKFYTTLSDYQTTIDQLQNQITNNNNNLQNQITNNYNNIQINSNNIQDISGTLSVLDDKVKTNSTNISTNSNSINILSSSIAINSNNISINSNSINVLSSKITTNRNNISTNSNNISINSNSINVLSCRITTNRNNISTNSNNISINSSNISINSNSINVLSSSIAINSNNISINSNSINVLSSKITTNSNNISTNSNSINILSSNITINSTNISTNSNSINLLSGRITTNSNNINELSSELTSLTETVGNHTNSISDLQRQMTTANTNISDLQGRMTTVEGYNSRITTNSNNISTNSNSINVLSNNLSTLSGTVGSHTISITGLQNDMTNVKKYDGRITTNSNSINVLSNSLSTLSGTVGNHTSEINTINNNITTLTNNSNNNKDNITTLSSSLSTLSGTVNNINVFKDKFNGVNDVGLIGYNGVSYIDVANINNNTPRSILMYTNSTDRINDFQWNQTTGSTAAGFSNNGNLVNLTSYSWITSNVLTTTTTTGWQPLNIVGNNFYKSTFDGSGNMYAYNNSGNLIPINATNLKNQAGITVNQEGVIQNISGILKINKKINSNTINLSCNIPFSETSSLNLNQTNGTLTICDYSEAINNFNNFVKKVWKPSDYAVSTNEVHNLKLTIELPIKSFERHINNTYKFTKCIIGVYTQIFMCQKQQDIQILSNRSEIVSSNSNTMVYDNKEILLGTIPIIFNEDTVTVNKNIKLTTIVSGYYNPYVYNNDSSNTVNENNFTNLYCKFRILWVEGYNEDDNIYNGYIYNSNNSSILNDAYVTITLNDLSNIGINDNYIDQYFKINVDMDSSTKKISTGSNNSNINYIQQSTCLYLSVEIDDINFTPEQVINIIPSSS